MMVWQYARTTVVAHINHLLCVNYFHIFLLSCKSNGDLRYSFCRHRKKGQNRLTSRHIITLSSRLLLRSFTHVYSNSASIMWRMYCISIYCFICRYELHVDVRFDLWIITIELIHYNFYVHIFLSLSFFSHVVWRTKTNLLLTSRVRTDFSFFPLFIIVNITHVYLHFSLFVFELKHVFGRENSKFNGSLRNLLSNTDSSIHIVMNENDNKTFDR